MSTSRPRLEREDVVRVLERAGRGCELDIIEMEKLLSITDDALLEHMWDVADRVRAEVAGDAIHLRGLVEFSNHCRRACTYCGLRGGNRSLDRYRMTAEEILEAVESIVGAGIRTVVLQSGEDQHWSVERIVALIGEIKRRFDIALTLSLGLFSREALSAFREAGADRYLLRHETANPRLYRDLHPDGSLAERIRMLEDLEDLGFEVGTGSLVGLPGQTYRDMAKDIDLARRLKVDMYGVGPFIPHPGTPLGRERGGSALDTYKMIALARIVLRDVHIPVTTALATLDEDARELGWQRGANVVMPNATPGPYRELYELYRDKRCLRDSLDRCSLCLKMRIASVGRHISRGYGESLGGGGDDA